MYDLISRYVITVGKGLGKSGIRRTLNRMRVRRVAT